MLTTLFALLALTALAKSCHDARLAALEHEIVTREGKAYSLQ